MTDTTTRYLTSAEWTAKNPHLDANEYGIERDTGKGKLGDGSSRWNALGYSTQPVDDDTLSDDVLPPRLADTELRKVFAQRTRAVAVPYAATVTPNADTMDVLNVGALTGNVTIANPTGTPLDGQGLRVRLAQDATGSRTVTFGSAFAFGTDVTAASVPTTASAKWEMFFVWNAASSKWRATSIVRGF